MTKTTTTGLAITMTSKLMMMIEAKAGEAAIERLRAALSSAVFASAIVKVSSAGGDPALTAKPYVEMLQAAGVAALIDQDAHLARLLKADGVHVKVGETAARIIADAKGIVGGGQIVGADVAGSRHCAMEAGEGGADYVAFSGPGHVDLVQWWAELFEVPCVAMGDGRGVSLPHEAALLAAAGADFVVVALPEAQTAGDIAALTKEFQGALAEAGQSMGR